MYYPFELLLERCVMVGTSWNYVVSILRFCWNKKTFQRCKDERQ